MVRTQLLLRWLYTGRLVLVAAIFLAALYNWLVLPYARETLLATVALLSALGMTAFGIWWVEVRGRGPGRNFLYFQVLYDTLLVTAVVYITGSAASPFAPLYILVITAAALLLPLPGGMLIGALSALLFFTNVLVQNETPTRDVFLRIALFGAMAIVTAAVGDRLRRTGTALGAIESELRQLRLDTNEMLAAIDTGLVTVDGAGRLTYMNEAATQLLGLSASAWDGRPVLEELDRTAPGLGTLVRRTAATRVAVGRFEIRRAGALGDRYLGVRTTVLDREGMPWVTAVLQDITETKQIEDLIRRAERLQAVAELGASLAHEIKNPLASIRSAVELMSGERLGTDDRDKLRRLVVGESERLSRLLAEFMEFSRVEMRKWAQVDLAHIAGDAVELAMRHPDRRAETQINFVRPRTPAFVDGDHDLLHRAVFNLLLNAVQHTGAEGTVTVAVDRPAEDLPPSVQMNAPVRLTVSDTGPGVREEDIPRMFDPFFTTRTGGTGLGLALVHRAVEAHRGAILVDSNRNGGARFTIYLPAHTTRELEHGPKAAG